jgi:hypothetical protein
MLYQTSSDGSASNTAMADYLRKTSFKNVQEVSGVGVEAA